MDDSGFVGEHHGLGAVSRTDFGEEVPDVCAHRRLAQVQPSGDLGVGQATGEEDEHLALPVGHPVQARDELGGGLVQSQVTFDQSPGHAWCEQRVSGGNGSYRSIQGVAGSVLEQEAAGTGTQRSQYVFVEVECG
jgi:hypothetical protein